MTFARPPLANAAATSGWLVTGTDGNDELQRDEAEKRNFDGIGGEAEGARDLVAAEPRSLVQQLKHSHRQRGPKQLNAIVPPRAAKRRSSSCCSPAIVAMPYIPAAQRAGSEAAATMASAPDRGVTGGYPTASRRLESGPKKLCTHASSSSGLGLPQQGACGAGFGAFEAVMVITGMAENRGSACNAARSSWPLIIGMLRSRRISLGRIAAFARTFSASNAARPSSAVTQRNPHPRAPGERVRECRVHRRPQGPRYFPCWAGSAESAGGVKKESPEFGLARLMMRRIGSVPSPRWARGATTVQGRRRNGSWAPRRSLPRGAPLAAGRVELFSDAEAR